MASSWINPEFVQEVLNHGDPEHIICVKNVRVEPAISTGNNFLGVIYRVYFNIEGDYKNISRTLIVKTLPEGDFFRKGLESIFARELRMYDTAFIAMYKESHEKLDDYNITPKQYTSPKENMIVLEDLKYEGFSTVERQLQLDMDHSISAIGTLAKLHGMSIVMDILNPKIKEKFGNSLLAGNAILPMTFKSLVKKFENWQGQEHFLPKLRQLSEIVEKRFEEVSQPGLLMVLNHGDYWVNNILFRYSDERISDVRMLDFQMSRWASPAYDLYYFIYSSCQEQVRELYRDMLLSEYHASLSATLTSLGHPEKIFSLEQLHQEMEEKMFLGLVFACTTMCVTLAEPEGAMDMSNMTEESVKSGDANPIALTTFSPKFKEVFPKVLHYFEENGVL